MNDNPQTIVATVSGGDLLSRLDTLSTKMARIEAKIDDIPVHVRDLENRVRTLEQWRWRAAGIATGISVLISSGISGIIIAIVQRRP